MKSKGKLIKTPYGNIRVLPPTKEAIEWAKSVALRDMAKKEGKDNED